MDLTSYRLNPKPLLHQAVLCNSLQLVKERMQNLLCRLVRTFSLPFRKLQPLHLRHGFLRRASWWQQAADLWGTSVSFLGFFRGISC